MNGFYVDVFTFTSRQSFFLSLASMHQRFIVVRVAVHWSSGIKDTVEAKLLQPAIDADVTLYEDVARWTVCRVCGVVRMISHWKTCFSYLNFYLSRK